MGSEHKKTVVRHQGHSAAIDEEIAPLILELWKAHIATASSCQESPKGRAWIRFASPADALSFVNVVSKYVPEEEPFYRRMIGKDKTPRDWKFALEPKQVVEWAGVPDQLNWKPPAKIAFEVSLWIPTDDIGVVAALLKDYNAAA